MKDALKNIKGNPLTSNTGIATGIAVGVISIFKMFKIDLGELVGVDSEYILLALSSLISALVNMVARDPKKNESTVPKQN